MLWVIYLICFFYWLPIFVIRELLCLWHWEQLNEHGGLYDGLNAGSPWLTALITTTSLAPLRSKKPMLAFLAPTKHSTDCAHKVLRRRPGPKTPRARAELKIAALALTRARTHSRSLLRPDYVRRVGFFQLRKNSRDTRLDCRSVDIVEVCEFRCESLAGLTGRETLLQCAIADSPGS